MRIFKKLGFKPNDINLYYKAFTHTSFSNENPDFVSYERLEFLGDAILEFIISEYLEAVAVMIFYHRSSKARSKRDNE